MKFSDGYWLMRDGVRASYPTQARHVQKTDDGLVVHAPAHPVRERGDTLKGPLLTYTFTAPAPDVVGVRITHFAGGVQRPPEFGLLRQPGAATVRVEDAEASLTAGRLRVVVARGDRWDLRFEADGRRLTGSGTRAAAVVDTVGDVKVGAVEADAFGDRGAGAAAAGRHYVREQLDLDPAAHVYGLGERFGPLVKNGQVVDIWNADGGTSSEQAYKNVPF